MAPACAMQAAGSSIAQASKAAVVISENPAAALQLQHLGLQPETYHPRQVCEQSMRHIHTHIHTGHFAVVWIDLPKSGRAVPPRKWSPTVREIALWIRSAKASRVPAVLAGWRGKHWQHEELAKLTQEEVVHESRHALCRYGVVHRHEGSCSVYHAFTTTPAQNARCRCSISDSLARGRGDGVLAAVANMYAQFVPRMLQLWQIVGPRQEREPDSESYSYSYSNLDRYPKRQSESASFLLDASPKYGAQHSGASSSIGDTTPATAAYPTEAREREKQRKQSGHVAKKRMQQVEDHFDDLGDDLSGLGGDLALHTADTYVEELEPDFLAEKIEPEVGGLLALHFRGSAALPDLPSVFIARNLDEACSALLAAGPGVDIAEFCGGAARSTTVAIRRNLVGGRNFDLVTHVDLGHPSTQQEALRYLDENVVLVLVMAPSCRAFGPPSHVNYVVNHATWRTHYDEDAPHVRFCGKAALHQLHQGRHFFVEQPSPTWLFHEPPWPTVCQHPQVKAECIDQCMVGLVNQRGERIRKPTVLVASHPALLEPFAGLRCSGRHLHGETWGSGLRHLQAWTWNFAERIVEGIVRLKMQLKHDELGLLQHSEDVSPTPGDGGGALVGRPVFSRSNAMLHADVPGTGDRRGALVGRPVFSRSNAMQHTDVTSLQARGALDGRPVSSRSNAMWHTSAEQLTAAYPSVGIGPADDAAGAEAEEIPATGAAGDSPQWMRCPGCRARMARGRREHNREEGVCKYPFDRPEPEWKCPGCSRSPPRPRGHEDHTDRLGECRWADASYRFRGATSGREGRHPREGRVRASSSSVADLPGSELNPGTRREPGHPELPPDSDSSPSPPRPQAREVETPVNGGSSGSNAGSAQAAAAGPGAVPAAAAESDSAGTEDGARATRGPDRQPRQVQPRLIDRAVGDAHEDWTSFDVNRSMRMLRTGSEAQISRELRKLHLRWWHAGRVQMERVLSAAGVPKEVLGKVASTIDTCRECRAWQKPEHEVTPVVELVTRQNEFVEADILFYKQFMAWHMLDRADRWHASTVITSKTGPSLCTAIDLTWVTIFGPFQYLVVDGESGLITEDSAAYLKSRGITYRPRAPGQHARMIERRGAILRHSMHCMEQQLARENVQVEFAQLLAEATFAGNALISHNGATPFNARFGRQPAMLPDLQVIPEWGGTVPGRDLQRVREVALQKIIESTAIARINRARRTVTTASGEALNYQPGELVDFHRPTMTKDAQAWHGPAEVIRSEPHRGLVILKWRGEELLAKYGDVRRFMDFTAHVFGFIDSDHLPHGQVWRIIQAHLDSQAPRHFSTFGFHVKEGTWHPTTDSMKFPRAALALEFAVRNIWCLKDVFALRLGKALSKLPPHQAATFTTVLWWRNHAEAAYQHVVSGAPSLSTAELVGPEWEAMTYVQAFHRDEPEVDMRSLCEPDHLHEPSTQSGSGGSARADPSGRTDISDPERLTAIPEERWAMPSLAPRQCRQPCSTVRWTHVCWWSLVLTTGLQTRRSRPTAESATTWATRTWRCGSLMSMPSCWWTRIPATVGSRSCWSTTRTVRGRSLRRTPTF